MNEASFPLAAASPAELGFLNGKTVLVRSSRDDHNPPTAMRGTLEVRDFGAGPVVQIALEFPQMFTTRAHHRTLTLEESALERLLESERDGTFGLTVDEPLGPEARPGSE